jgi:hypothetical protein
VAKGPPSGRQGLRGSFEVLSLALKFAFPGNRRLGLQRLGSRFLLTLVKLRPGLASYRVPVFDLCDRWFPSILKVITIVRHEAGNARLKKLVAERNLEMH